MACAKVPTLRPCASLPRPTGPTLGTTLTVFSTGFKLLAISSAQVSFISSSRQSHILATN
eukprot:m.351294 g.351294  ORF g.351294 m.351294 type:complete len:60 (+) comp55907_c0_seq21:2053-2232(+)